ncbi:GTP binding protein [Apophysomyces ossiformis]|uniref:GTP binding protein n=1 Tax=Apophysomyces ossiformis TaxID=679940 RepID=A0A8H7BT20_9FUNG|nr:GTP binding protein [Apophysomyces ossiformis]
MYRRLSEGDGEAIYELGVSDDGTFIGLSVRDMSMSLETLHRMANALDADISVVREVDMDQLANIANNSPRRPGHKLAEVLVRKRSAGELQPFTDIRVAVVGGFGVGKSTLLGRIAHGVKDNGRGRGRLNVLRHRHEIKSGRTSSISHEIIGYDSEGSLINYATTDISTWEQICASSSKIITFLDTCGDSRYLRTTVSGLTGYAPDYACLVVSATEGYLSEMTLEHLSLAVMLGMQVFVVMTKIDSASSGQLKQTLDALAAVVKAPGMNRIPILAEDTSDLFRCASNLSSGGREMPIFCVSSVTGFNMDLLEQFFNLLPKPTVHSDEILEKPVEFQVEEIYVLEDVGVVVGGILRQGRINIGDSAKERSYYMGPDSKGKFLRVSVMSIRRHRMPSEYIHCGQAATLGIESSELTRRWIKKGMVILGTDRPESFLEIKAEIIVLHHPTGVTIGTCGMLHSGSVRQRARVIAVSFGKKANASVECSEQEDGAVSGTEHKEESTVIASGYQGMCTFRFLAGPAFLRVGAQILFMEGKSKCVGRVTELIRTANDDFANR